MVHVSVLIQRMVLHQHQVMWADCMHAKSTWKSIGKDYKPKLAQKRRVKEEMKRQSTDTCKHGHLIPIRARTVTLISTPVPFQTVTVPRTEVLKDIRLLNLGTARVHVLYSRVIRNAADPRPFKEMSAATRTWKLTCAGQMCATWIPFSVQHVTEERNIPEIPERKAKQISG